MKKNNTSANKQSANSIRITDIPAVIFFAALVARIVANSIPASVGDVLHPISLIVGALALLAHAILWICIKVKSRKKACPSRTVRNIYDGAKHKRTAN